MPQAASASKPLHIFKPGEWTTIRGERINFTAADLQATAQAYDPKKSKAPLVVGHPKTDDPAKGWTVSLSASERGLFAIANKVDPEFAESVTSGAYGTVSAKFYRPEDRNNPVPGVWYLRHIGFLGAHPPGVKGLDDPEFGESDDSEGVCFQEGVAFGEWDGMTNANLWRNLREWFLGKFGPEEADKVLPGYDVRALEVGAADDINNQRQKSGLPVAFGETDKGGEPTPSPQPPQESTVTEEEAALLREDNARKDRELKELREKDAKRQEAEIQADSAAFAESMVSEARIPAAMKGQVAAIGAQLATAPDVEFGEGDAKKPLGEAFRDFVRALPQQVSLREQAARDRAAAADTEEVEFAEGADPDRAQQDKRIRAYAKEHKVDYATAAHTVMRSK